MKIKKKYTFRSKRQIWRIIPTETNKLVIEEREPEKKQAYFICLQTESGKRIFKDFQHEEKFWVGIEAVYNDLIFFHSYLKPDMPGHKGILAFDIAEQEIKWENKDLTFLFQLNNLIYTYLQRFDSRNHYALNFETGEIEEDFGSDSNKINKLRDEAVKNQSSKDYLFPRIFYDDSSSSEQLISFFEKLKTEELISGRIEFILIDPLLLFCYHSSNSKNSMDIFLKAVDLNSGNYILEEKLVEETKLFLSDSFFVKSNLLFVLFGKSKLNVYELRN
ncbi:MAG: DUF4905 domain-containing protein [Ignavibacteria bacterium]|nr:DUF4905 domain-containing protein [Ignavibacteria bacterium]MBT8393070.1 DUF4905 domain-containing protein [Ignavibacteria bacterium]NNJ53587.1 DUF4905 domain-containing protein [Ignavibacteriaceae bacterium]